MENLTDYSNYVIVAYIAAGLVLSALAAFIVTKFFAAK